MSTADQTEQSTKRTRRREQRSCMFCKKRKLKCDQTRPICGQCKKRGFQECAYPQDLPLSVHGEELYEKFPNLKLAKRVSQLEAEARLNSVRGTSGRSGPTSNLRQYFDKDTGSIYGFSSLKCFANTKVGSLQDFYMKSTQKVFREYDETWGHCTDALSGFISNSTSSIPRVIEVQLCADIGSLEWIQARMTNFFNSSLYDIMGVVDQDKTLRDIGSIFTTSADNEDSGKSGKVIAIDLSKTNVFSLGIILMIIRMSPGVSGNYPGLEACIRYITNIASLGTKYVERVQFLVLALNGKVCDPRYSFTQYDEVRSLMSHLCHCCITLGLQDVDTFYVNNCTTGEAMALKHTFYWTMLLDIRSSLFFGTPVAIRDEDLNLNSVYNDKPICSVRVNMRRNNLIKRFIRLSRTVITAFNRTTGMSADQVTSSIDILSEFIKADLLPLKFYTDVGHGIFTDTFDIIVLGTTLEILLMLSHSRQIYCTEVNEQANKDIKKFATILSQVAMKFIIASHDQDSYSYSELFKDDDIVTPHLQLSLVIVETFLVRSITHLFKYAFDGWYVKRDGSQEQASAFDLSEVDAGIEEIHLLFQSIFQEKNQSLVTHIKHSGLFVSVSLLESVSYLSWKTVKQEAQGIDCDELRPALANILDEMNEKHFVQVSVERFQNALH